MLTIIGPSSPSYLLTESGEALLADPSDPAATRLTTVAALRVAMGAEGEALDFDVALQLIDQASSLICSYLGRTALGRETVRETVRPNPNDGRPRPIVLHRSPLVSVISVTADGVPLVADTDYEVDPAGLLHRLCGAYYTRWCATKVIIDYTAGWLLPGQPGRTLPQDIEACCIDLCRALLTSRSRDPLLRSQSVLNGLVTESFQTGAASEGGLPPDIACRLSPYREFAL